MIMGKPVLITLEGENIPALSGDEINYLKENYPELLGFWAKLIKGIGKAAGGIFKGIGRAVRRKRAKRKAQQQAAAAERARALQLQKLNAIIAQRRAAQAAQAKKQQTTLLTAAAAIPIAAALLLGK